MYFTSCRGETNCPKQTVCSETSKKTDTAGHMFQDQLSCPGTCPGVATPLVLCLYETQAPTIQSSHLNALWIKSNDNRIMDAPKLEHWSTLQIPCNSSIFIHVHVSMHTIDVLCRKRTACSPALSSMGNDLK